MGDRDARTLSEGFSEFDSNDLQSLAIGEAIGRIEQAKYDFSLKTYSLPEVDDEIVKHKINAIRQVSREKYATPLVDVENELNKNRPGFKKDDSHSIKNNTHSKVEPSKSKPATNTTSAKGKGGDRHKQIQNLLQKAAHDKGFGAIVEKHIGDGQHIDLVLHLNDVEVACEISVSTSVIHEVSNIKKMCKCGFKTIWCISENKQYLQKIQKSIQDVKYLNQSIFSYYTVEQAIENDFVY